MIKANVGRSIKPDPKEAGKEAAEIALKGVGGKAKIFFVFSTVAYDQEKMLEGVRSVAKDVPVVGCSSSGEITTDGPGFRSVAVMALDTDTIDFFIGVGKGTDKDSFAAGKEAAEEVKKKAEGRPIQLFMEFIDGLAENGAAVVRGVQEVFGKNMVIMGGSAGDDFQFKKTFQYYNDQVFSNAVVGIGLSGKFAFGVGVRHGWEAISLPFKITKAEGAKIIEIDNRPAVSIYEDYFGKQAEELKKEPIARLAYTYPLGLLYPGAPEYLIRDVVFVGEKGELICAAEIPEGSEVRLMLGDPDKAIRAAREAAENAMNQLKEQGAKPKAVFVFDCMARCKLLGQGIKTPEECNTLREVFGYDVPIIGFYTYGEQAPIAGKIGPDAFSVFHNETMTLVALGERED